MPCWHSSAAAAAGLADHVGPRAPERTGLETRSCLPARCRPRLLAAAAVGGDKRPPLGFCATTQCEVRMVDIGTALEGRPTLVSRRLICIPCRGALGHTWIRQQLDDSTCPCQQRERRSTCSVPGCEPVASATAERSRRIIWVDRRAPWRAQGQAHARRACSLALAHTPCYLGGAPRP